MDMSQTNDPTLWRHLIPRPGPDTHKHQRGRLGVVTGPALQTGAARLAGRAGLRVGAGLVLMLCPPDAAPIVAGAVEALMVQAFDTPEALAEVAKPLSCVVIGPAAGLNRTTEANLRALMHGGAALVVDADALTWFAGRPKSLFDSLRRGDVITPHVGEFERLFPGLLKQGREQAALEASRQSGAHVILKGHETVIAAPDGRLCINGHGSPWLATAGSGDVLAGLVGGLIAQRMEPFEAACAAVWIHGDAACRFGPGLIAEDLPDLVPAVMTTLM